MTGELFGRLTVISHSHKNKVKSYWNCQCSCGKTTVVDTYSLKSGNTKSCGCLRQEKLNEEHKKRKKHGLSHTKIYFIWFNMLRKGLQVCEQWHDVTTFYAWAKNNGYEEGLTIARKDLNKKFSPENCYFIKSEKFIKNV